MFKYVAEFKRNENIKEIPGMEWGRVRNQWIEALIVSRELSDLMYTSED